MVDKRWRRSENRVVKAVANPRPLDATDRRLVVALSRDGRRAAADLAKELGLSRQAVTDRIRDLERRGVIRGYRADVDPAALGLGVRAQVRISLDGSVAHGKERDVLKRLTRHPMVRSVYRVSGEDCFVAEVVCRRIQDVSAILGDLQATRAVQSSRTAFVLEAVMEKGLLGPLEPALVEQDAAPGATRAVARRARRP
jgi:Lrp/AsnC family transcriptional regulator, leucine-responsive regulatory protein